MDETPLTNQELTEAVRKLQNDVLNLTERLRGMESAVLHRIHVEAPPLPPTAMTHSYRESPERPIRLERKSPLPSRLRTT